MRSLRHSIGPSSRWMVQWTRTKTYRKITVAWHSSKYCLRQLMCSMMLTTLSWEMSKMILVIKRRKWMSLTEAAPRSIGVTMKSTLSKRSTPRRSDPVHERSTTHPQSKKLRVKLKAKSNSRTKSNEEMWVYTKIKAKSWVHSSMFRLQKIIRKKRFQWWKIPKVILKLSKVFSNLEILNNEYS